LEKLRTSQLAFSLLGCFLGAGFVSGQEIWQFFGHFGLWGFAGIVLAMGILSALCAVIFSVSRRTGLDQMDQLVVPWENKVLRGLVGAVAISFMFGVYVVMTAGAGTLLEQLTGSRLLHLLGSGAFCIAVSVIAARGIRGAVSVFSKLMPVLVVLSLVVMGTAILTFGRGGISFQTAAVSNPLVNHWALAAVTFVSYNFLCALGTLSWLGRMTSSYRSIVGGTLLGGTLLLVVAGGIITALSTAPESTTAELPMLYLAGKLHPCLEAVYAAVLLMAMFGASLSSFAPIPQYCRRIVPLEKHRKFVLWALSALAWGLSLLGFSKLIGTVFPVYGLIDFLFLIGLVLHFFLVFRRQPKEKAVEGQKR